MTRSLFWLLLNLINYDYVRKELRILSRSPTLFFPFLFFFFRYESIYFPTPVYPAKQFIIIIIIIIIMTGRKYLITYYSLHILSLMRFFSTFFDGGCGCGCCCCLLLLLSLVMVGLFATFTYITY